MADEVSSTQPCVVKVLKLQEKYYKKEDFRPTDDIDPDDSDDGTKKTDFKAKKKAAPKKAASGTFHLDLLVFLLLLVY